MSAQFVRVSICAPAESRSAPLVATARAAETPNGVMILAAPAVGLPTVPLAGVPSGGIARAFGIEPGGEEVIVAESAPCSKRRWPKHFYAVTGTARRVSSVCG